VGHCSKIALLMNISLYSWPKRDIRVFYHPNQNVWLHHCSKSFCKSHLKPLAQVALTSTSNSIHEEGKYIIICINRYQLNACHQDIPQLTLYRKAFFHAFRQAKFSIRFLQFRTDVTSDFNARPTYTAELRWKAVLLFLYRVANNSVVLLLHW